MVHDIVLYIPDNVCVDQCWPLVKGEGLHQRLKVGKLSDLVREVGKYQGKNLEEYQDILVRILNYTELDISKNRKFTLGAV